MFEKVVILCLENFYNGYFYDKFLVVMFAYIDRIEKLEDIFFLVFKFCLFFFFVFGEENEIVKKRLKKI